MLAPDMFTLFIERLDTAGIRYVVTGSVAVIVYGDPRMTHDIDLVVEVSRKQIPAIIDAFPEGEFYCPPAEVIGVECARSTRGHFNIIHHVTGFKADIYPVGNDGMLAWAIRNPRMFNLGGIVIRVAPPEYVIAKKLEYFKEGRSPKHVGDIRGMLEASADCISFEKLNELIEKQGLADVWLLVTTSDANKENISCN
ncbi:MAG: hypothetical protein WCP20_21590 [Desulfuromonadales bacterium]